MGQLLLFFQRHKALFEDVTWKHCIRKFAKKASCFPIRS